MSKIIEMLTDRDFAYNPPYFYNNPYSLRCELGVGNDRKTYLEEAKKRLFEIYDILFPKKADAIFFNYWICDLSSSGDAEISDYGEDWQEVVESCAESVAEEIRFLSQYQILYRHISVEDLAVDESCYDPSKEKRNRIICFADDKGFDDKELLLGQINEQNANRCIGLVSFENDCILSAYDDRGCDIVFAEYERMREFYKKLEAYFLDYDRIEMKRRLELGERKN